MVKSVSSLGDELEVDCRKLQEWMEITWMVEWSCMFSIAGGSGNSKLISLVLIIYLILLFFQV